MPTVHCTVVVSSFYLAPSVALFPRRPRCAPSPPPRCLRCAVGGRSTRPRRSYYHSGARRRPGLQEES
jgi:hypothetical protein